MRSHENNMVAASVPEACAIATSRHESRNRQLLELVRGTVLAAFRFEQQKETAQEKAMRLITLSAIAAAAVLLAACGSDEKTVVVNPQQPQPNTTVVTPPPPPAAQGNTVVVPQGPTTKVCPSGAITC
jgi:hypothetical protein